MMPEYRHLRSSSLNIPNGSPTNSAAALNSVAAAAPRFDGPRSPPNTSHVPCKFFRQGTCQAGNACPFSHDLGASADTVCKYFAKGNCKFGPKCANIHVLPDGRRINYGKNGVTIASTAAPITLSGRSSRGTLSAAGSGYQKTTSASALTTSLYHNESPHLQHNPYEDRHQLGRQPSLENGLPSIDAPYSYHNSAYGSPRDDDRFGLALSPANSKGLSVLDAPLPASFDSNGISNAARFPAGPWPSSVPSKFGLESPTPSLSNAKDSRTSETLKLLHTSAFGSSEHLLTPTNGSPPTSQPLNGEEYFGRRAMHSSRYTKSKLMSSSVPKVASVDRDWEPEFAFGDDAPGDNVPENYVPENLQELLTPAEKARRGSMRADDESPHVTKYGSPIGTSPSRWGPLFQRQKEEEENLRAARGAASVFGHVGSPLRNSTLAQEMGINSGGYSSGRPSVLRSGSEGMSVLSQQLQRTRIDDAPGGSSPHLHPMTATQQSPIRKERAIERHVSSGSLGGSSVTGRFTTPIDEEEPTFVFSMEDEDDASSVGTSAAARMRKRSSLGLSMGTYAGGPGRAASGRGKDSRESVTVNGP